MFITVKPTESNAVKTFFISDTKSACVFTNSFTTCFLWLNDADDDVEAGTDPDIDTDELEEADEWGFLDLLETSSPLFEVSSDEMNP